jgi:hypothetical protein
VSTKEKFEAKWKKKNLILPSVPGRQIHLVFPARRRVLDKYIRRIYCRPQVLDKYTRRIYCRRRVLHKYSVISSPSVFVSAFGEEPIHRVPDGKHSASTLTLGVIEISSSDSMP